MFPPSIAAAVKRFRHLPAGDRRMLIEAVCCLAAARLATACLPFRVVARLASRRTGRRVVAGSQPELIRRVRWATLACARRLSWRAGCLEQGLAAQRMLRRRGVPSVLYFGVARDRARGLAAHVWVRVGGSDAIGCETASAYVVLARFPADLAS